MKCVAGIPNMVYTKKTGNNGKHSQRLADKRST